MHHGDINLARAPAPPAEEAKAFRNEVISDGKTYRVLTQDLGHRYGLVVTQTFCAGSVVATRKTNYPAVDRPDDLRHAVARIAREQHQAAMRTIPARGLTAAPLEEPLPTTTSTLVGAQPTPSMGVPLIGHAGYAELVAPDHVAHLEMMDGALIGERLALHASPLALGPGGPLALGSEWADAIHCVFLHDHLGWTLGAPHPAAGVTVNGEVCTTRLLAHGDVIRVGGLDLRFLDVKSLGAVLRERPADAPRPTSRLRPTLLPLLVARLSWASPLPGEQAAELERQLAALAHFGPTQTPSLFEDRDAQLAYALNTFVTVAALALSGAHAAQHDPRTSLGQHRVVDGQLRGLVELDRTLCGFGDPRTFAAVRAALSAPGTEAPFSADDLEARLDLDMRRWVDEPRAVRVSHASARVAVSAEAWPFLTPFEQAAGGSAIDYLGRFAGIIQAGRLESARRLDYAVVFAHDGGPS